MSNCKNNLFQRAILVLMLSIGSAVPQAEYQELDSIVAIVEDDVVLASELLSRLETIRQQFGADAQLPPDDILLNQIMERLIIESLQMREAEMRGVSIDDETLTQAVMSFAQQNQMTLEQFLVALESEGVSYVAFREQVRQEMMITRLQRNLVSRRITISEQELDNLLNAPYYRQLFADDFRVGHILLSFDVNASEEVKDRAMAEARRLVTALRQGADFAQTAVANSSSSTALEGGDLGWRKAGELPSLFAEEVLAMSVGDIAEPIVSRGGIHIIKLLEQRGAGVQKQQQANLRHILVQPSAIRTAVETQAFIEEVRARIEAGEDFAELAKLYSEDPGSALNGGDLGWTSGAEFVPAFQAAMEETATGSLSQPFQSQYGWHILEIMDRREQDTSEDTLRERAWQIVHQRRFEEELQEWLKELRDEAFVEFRLTGAVSAGSTP